MGLQASTQTATMSQEQERKRCSLAGLQKVEQKKSSLTRVTEESWSPHEGKVRIQIRKSGALKLAEGRVRHDPSSQGTGVGSSFINITFQPTCQGLKPKCSQDNICL